mgnify:CR=1 FL=1
MIRRTMIALVGALALSTAATRAEAQQPQAYGRQWAQSYNTQDWSRFLHYPYVWYPQDFWGPDYYKSAQSLYFRYPPEMRIPVYNKRWQNEYPQARRSPPGPTFLLDTF